jgi:hypothetical protein
MGFLVTLFALFDGTPERAFGEWLLVWLLSVEPAAWTG